MPYAEEEDDELAALLWMEEQANATGPQVRSNNFAYRPAAGQNAVPFLIVPHTRSVCAGSCRVASRCIASRTLQHRRTLQK
jgi:hypothetical protein